MDNYKILVDLYNSARKNKDEIIVNCLSTMKGEIDNQLKLSKESPNDLIVKYAIKSKKNLLDYKPKNWEIEISILDQFIPSQLSNDDIISEIEKLYLSSNKELAKSNFGFYMGTLSKSLKGKVDSSILKQLIESKLQ